MSVRFVDEGMNPSQCFIRIALGVTGGVFKTEGCFVDLEAPRSGYSLAYRNREEAEAAKKLLDEDRRLYDRVLNLIKRKQEEEPEGIRGVFAPHHRHKVLFSQEVDLSQSETIAKLNARINALETENKRLQRWVKELQLKHPEDGYGVCYERVK